VTPKSLTQKKLRETEFFVRLLTADDADWWERDPEAGDFYLSAFLSAARQVTATLAKRAAGYEQ
jgi:hypothetical protein